MLNRILMVFIVVLITLTIIGCSSVKVADKFNGQNISQTGTPVANIDSSNYGFYLFSCLPIVAGDPNDPDSWHLFQDTVTVDGAYKALTKKSNSLGATKIINVRSEEKWSTNPFTYGIAWTKEVEVTGDAVK